MRVWRVEGAKQAEELQRRRFVMRRCRSVLAARLLKIILPFRTLVTDARITSLGVNAVLMPFQCSIGTLEGPRCAALHGFVLVAVSIITSIIFLAMRSRFVPPRIVGSDN